MKLGFFLAGMMGRCGALAAFFVLAAPVSGEEPIASSDLVLVGIAEAGGVTYASVVDAQNGEHFLPSTRGADGGFELVSTADNESAVIRQNGQSFLLRLGWARGTGQPANDFARPAALTGQTIPRPGVDPDAAPTAPPGEKLPLVFQSGDMKGLNLSDDQKAIITRLRAQFVAAIGGSAGAANEDAGANAATDAAANGTAPGVSSSNATPTAAPSPQQKWESAQQESDDTFKMLFGYQAFNLYQMGLQAKPVR